MLGIVTSVVIGVLLYRGVVSMNLAMFFKVTGAALIVIAAGVLAYGVHDLQEAGIVPGIDNLAWNIDGWEITSWYGALLKGIFNLGPQMTVLEVAVYLGYLVPTMVLFLRPARTTVDGRSASRAPGHAATARRARSLSRSTLVPRSTSPGVPPCPHAEPSLAVPVAALLALTACSTESADSTVDVTGTDDACIIAQDIVDAGKVGFEFLNESSDVNELYVLKANGDTLGEVENVTTGTSRTLTVDLVAGDYLVRCKPGQTGDGFESPFTVTGDGGTAQAEPDREIAFDAVDFGTRTSTWPDRRRRHDPVRDGRTPASRPTSSRCSTRTAKPIGEVAATEPGRVGWRHDDVHGTRRLHLPVHPGRPRDEQAPHRTRHDRHLRRRRELTDPRLVNSCANYSRTSSREPARIDRGQVKMIWPPAAIS